MKQIKLILKKLLITALVILTVSGLYAIHTYYIYGVNPWTKFYNDQLYPKIPYFQMVNITKIKEAKNECEINGGEWKLKNICGRSDFDKDHPRLDDFACYKHYEDGGKPCRSSNDCEGDCRFNDIIIQPLLGICDETDEPTCCNDLMENIDSPDFGNCNY